MTTVIFDFERIGSIQDFYTLASDAFNLSDHFGENLDALWDVLTGDIALPTRVQFTNMSMGQLERFDKLISLFEEAADTLGEEFVFEYFLKKG